MNDYDIGRIMQAMEIELIKSMKRNLEVHENWEKAEGFKWEQWQAKKIREIRKYRSQNMAIMTSYSRKIAKATKGDLKRQYIEGGRKVDKEVKRAIDKGLSMVKGTPSDDFFQGDSEKLDKLIKSINSDMQSAQNAALRKMNDVYRRTIFQAETFLGSGAYTLNQAVDMAAKDFLSNGINCIRYADGRYINIASYSRMAVRTANKRVFLMGEGERRKEWGLSLVLISQYTGCSPLCLPWQGRVFIDDVYSGGKIEDGDYPRLSTAIEGSLFHPNCKHISSTFFEGINEEPEKIRKDELGEEYEKAKREAEINRNIQKYTRLESGSLDSGNIKKYGELKKKWQNELKIFNSKKEDDIIKKELKKVGIIGKITLNPLIPNLEKTTIDAKHIKKRNHKVSFEEAEIFIREAKFTSTKWRGKFINYYGHKGAAYINTETNEIRTAFKADEYDDKIKKALEVLKKNGR